jgi:predicted secreted hydrolase
MHYLQRFSFLMLALMILFSACSMPGASTTSKVVSPSPTSTTTIPPLKLPQDEAPHTYLSEWWYYTGHLSGKDSTGKVRDYGFEFTIFQILLGSTSPVYIGHYAVTDLTRNEFHYDQRTTANLSTPTPNNNTSTGFDLAIDDWTMKGFNGQDRLIATMADYSINFTLAGNKPATLHNGTGIISYGAAGFSYYYSRTNMSLSGMLQDHNESIPVVGLAWMDHQWGNFITIGNIGWDWFSIQLDNGNDYMIYVIRDSSGKITSTLGTLINAEGKATEMDASKIAITSTGAWTSPQTNITYPSGWNVVLPQGSLTVKPQIENQELVTLKTTNNTYWEGTCTVSGTIDNKAVTGKGYTELTGYHAK